MANSAKKEPEDLDVLAAEYVIGLMDHKERADFEMLAKSFPDADEARLAWENRLSDLNGAFQPLAPPVSLKNKIDQRLFASTTLTPSQSVAFKAKTGLWNALGFWRGLGLVGSAAAIALGVYSTQLASLLKNTNQELAVNTERLLRSDEILNGFETELASRGGQLDGLEKQLAEAKTDLGSANTNLASLQDQLTQAQKASQSVLVVSLESKDTDYRFLAVHEPGSDNVRMTLVSGPVEDNKDFELWLINPDKDIVSLGVVGAGKTQIELSADHLSVLESNGLLAVSVEQKGGSPTGVAQGPVVAVGKPQEI